MPESANLAAQMTPGFKDPVLQSQAAFRSVMAALAEPGLWHQMAADLTPPAALPLPAALTLADFETPVWLPPALSTGATGAWLRFHCNCPLVVEPAKAAFAVIDGGDNTMPALSAFAIGEDRFPDQAATILVLVTAREGGAAVSLTGPGIKVAHRVAPAGLRAGFWTEAADNARHYPLGLDLMLMDATHILGLPRSTQIEGGV
jgi:alpha-D-ribose 1-methylphosphonate 5-triphosphate synthase subunit PhnH